MVIVDSHCHLDMLVEGKSLVEDRKKIDEFIREAQDNGVKYIQTICTRMDDFPKILSISSDYDNVFASVGVHPSEVDSDIISWQKLLDMTQNPKVIGLGETGLDYFYNKEKDNHRLQQKSFEQHIEASQNAGIAIPVIIHTRDASEDTYSIIDSNMKKKTFPALIHCFTASKDFAHKMLNLGVYISISGIVTFSKAQELQDIVKYLPLESILVETDSPYLAPVPYRGKSNRPAYTRNIVEFIATLKGIEPSVVAEQTTKNFFNLFAKAKLNF